MGKRRSEHPPPPPQPFPAADDDGGTKEKTTVCYYYDPRISYADYGEAHHMVPHRATMTHALINAYGLLDHMDRLHVAPATEQDLELAHDPEFIRFLRDLTPAAYDADAKMQREASEKYNLGDVWNERTCCFIKDIPQHGYQNYYKSQEYKLHYHKEDGRKYREMRQNDAVTMEKVMNHLDRLSLELMPKPRPSDEQLDEEPPRAPPPHADGKDDTLVDRSPWVEDAVEKLHRRCGEKMLHEFFTAGVQRKQVKTS